MGKYGRAVLGRLSCADTKLYGTWDGRFPSQGQRLPDLCTPLEDSGGLKEAAPCQDPLDVLGCHLKQGNGV